MSIRVRGLHLAFSLGGVTLNWSLSFCHCNAWSEERINNSKIFATFVRYWSTYATFWKLSQNQQFFLTTPVVWTFWQMSQFYLWRGLLKFWQKSSGSSWDLRGSSSSSKFRQKFVTFVRSSSEVRQKFVKFVRSSSNSSEAWVEVLIGSQNNLFLWFWWAKQLILFDLGGKTVYFVVIKWDLTNLTNLTNFWRTWLTSDELD